MSGKGDTRAEPSLAKESGLWLRRRGCHAPGRVVVWGLNRSFSMSNPIADPLVEVPDFSATSELVRIMATRAGAVTVVMHRPERKNAFNADLISALSEAFETLRGAEGVRVVFLRGEGGTFSADADLDWMRAAGDRSESDNREDPFAMAQL